jgi:hypothetical protein
VAKAIFEPRRHGRYSSVPGGRGRLDAGVVAASTSLRHHLPVVETAEAVEIVRIIHAAQRWPAAN